jgi:hypothetical protein
MVVVGRTQTRKRKRYQGRDNRTIGNKKYKIIINKGIVLSSSSACSGSTPNLQFVSSLSNTRYNKILFKIKSITINCGYVITHPV